MSAGFVSRPTLPLLSIEQEPYSLFSSAIGTENIKVVNVETELLKQALALYQSRSDKTWGLTDCISLIVMQQQNLSDAATGDRHFIQAVFRALMLEV